MKKILIVLSLGVLTLFASCSEKELTPKQETRKVVETYLNNLFKDEPINGYKIDSLIIKDVTKKQELEKEAFKYKDLALKTLKKAKELGKEYQSTKELQNLATGLDASSTLNRLKQEFETLQTKIKEYSKQSQELAKKSQIADSITVLFYDVIARGTITSTNNVQKNAIFPFHISKDYKILKEPVELRQEQLNK